MIGTRVGSPGRLISERASGGASQIKAAARIIARAFKDDPLMNWVIPDSERRRRAAPRLYARSIEYAMKWGEVYATPGFEGVSAWLPPGQTNMTVMRLVRVGMLNVPFRLLPQSVWRLQRFNLHKARLHRRCAPGRHWHLLLLGVDPEKQGMGIGTALLEPILHDADRRGTSIYLDTTDDANNPFFEKHGFHVCERRAIPNGPNVWALVRDADLPQDWSERQSAAPERRFR